MDDLAVQHDGKVTRLCLDRPERRNALDRELMLALLAALDQVPASTEAVVVEANGPVFSAGHDLRELTGHRRRYSASLTVILAAAFRAACRYRNSR